MFTFLCLLSLALYSVVNSAAPSLPSEPKLPSSVCTTLNADHSCCSVDETKKDTSRIQDALDKCGSGKAVKLATSGSNNAFMSGALKLPSGVTLWIDKGVTLLASRDPRDFDADSNKHCGTLQSSDGGCHALITADNTKGSGVVGEGTIDGRGGSSMTGSSKSWWDIAQEAKDKGNSQNCPRLIQVNKGSDFTLYKITLKNAPKFHVVPSGVSGFTAWGVTINTPATARNTDGIDPAGCTKVVIAHCSISTGDDHVAIKGGSATSDLTIAYNKFGHGHGMSIGSETNGGVSNVHVYDLTIDGADNGLRIKSDSSKGGKVHNIHYEKVCIRSTDDPLVFDTYYSDSKGSDIPDFTDITLSGVHIISSGKKQVTFRGYDSSHPLKITLDNVVSDVSLDKITASNADITEGPGEVKGIPISTSSGTNVKIEGKSGSSSPVSCSF